MSLSYGDILEAVVSPKTAVIADLMLGDDHISWWSEQIQKHNYWAADYGWRIVGEQLILASQVLDEEVA